jgi:2Fe-2S ferredoxin
LKLHFVELSGNTLSVEATAGSSVMEAAVNYGVAGIDALCGGACACATCHVYIDPQWMALVGPPGTGEAGLLEEADFPRPESRLACQIRLTEDLNELRVTVAPRLDQ